MGDNTEKLIGDTAKELDSILSSKLDDLSSKSTEYISQVENLKIDAKKRFESFYGRKKWLDYLIIANLALTPIILIFVIYWTVFKK